jgi:hypothetical protein
MISFLQKFRNGPRVPFTIFFIFIVFFYYMVYEAIGTAAAPGLLCQPRVIVKMIVEKQMECRLARETEVLGENLPQRHPFTIYKQTVLESLCASLLNKTLPLCTGPGRRTCLNYGLVESTTLRDFRDKIYLHSSSILLEVESNFLSVICRYLIIVLQAKKKKKSPEVLFLRQKDVPILQTKATSAHKLFHTFKRLFKAVQTASWRQKKTLRNICFPFYGMLLVPTRYFLLSGYSYTGPKTSLRVHHHHHQIVT